MSAHKLLDELREAGLEVSASDGALLLKPKRKLTPALIEKAREQKAELLALLNAVPKSESLEPLSPTERIERDLLNFYAKPTLKPCAEAFSELHSRFLAGEYDGEALEASHAYMPDLGATLDRLFSRDTLSAVESKSLRAIATALEARDEREKRITSALFSETERAVYGLEEPSE